MPKSILTGNEAREKLFKGINLVADTVKSTLGPKGRNVIIKRAGQTPLITNDGATIAKEISLKDEFEDVGAQVIKEASLKTNKEAGDGTTTTAILTQSLINEGSKFIEEGADPIELRNGMYNAVDSLVRLLKEDSKKIENSEDIKKIATISSGSDLIGSLIAEAYDKIGKDGAITAEESKTNKTSIEIKEGYRVPVGTLPAYHEITDGKDTLDLEDVGIIVTTSKVDTLQPFANILNQIGQQGGKCIIFAESFSNPVIDALIVNYMRGLHVIGIDLSNCPDKNETLKDISIVTGAKLFCQEKGILHKTITMDDLGLASRVKLKKETEVLLMNCGGTKEAKEERIEQIRHELDENKSLNESERLRLVKRISSLTNGIAIINLGSSSELELGDLKLRVEDALCSVKSSLEEGIVTGAGSTFIRLVNQNNRVTEADPSISQSFAQGQKLVFDSVSSLLKQILINAQYTENKINDIIDTVVSEDKVYNLVTDTFDDIDKTTVFDPAKVERVSLETAVSVASQVLISETIITEEQENRGDIILEALGLNK